MPNVFTLSAATFIFLFLATPASSNERVFDIVVPDGADLRMVDGYTVLRQSGRKFGAVLTFMPESDTTAWIPVAVLNTSGQPLKVGTQGVSARHGQATLKVWSTSGLVRLAKEGRVSAPASLAEQVSGADSSTPMQAPTAPSEPRTIGSPASGTPGQRTPAVGQPPMLTNKLRRQQAIAVEQVTSLRKRLFRDETIASGQIGRGDVRIDLPPRGRADSPAQFVLTLKFGGERMDVRYRERLELSIP